MPHRGIRDRSLRGPNCLEQGGEKMPKVELNDQAPDFVLNDFQGNPVLLSDFRGKKRVVLVFNRGFT
jgi:hypothetical protein